MNDIFEERNSTPKVSTESPTPAKEFKEPLQREQWTVLTALNSIVRSAHNCALSDEFWAHVKQPLEYIQDLYKLSPFQVIAIGIIAEKGSATLADLARFIRCTHLEIMCYIEEINDLANKRFVQKEHSSVREIRYVLEKDFLKAIRDNSSYKAKSFSKLNVDGVINHILYYKTEVEKFSIDLTEMLENLDPIYSDNTELPLCNFLLSVKTRDPLAASMLTIMVGNHIQLAGTGNESVSIERICMHSDDEFTPHFFQNEIVLGTHFLLKEGHIEPTCDDGLNDAESFVLTRKFKDEFLKDATLKHRVDRNLTQLTSSLKKHTDIHEKNMYYNPSDEQQISRLTDLLSQEHFPGIQQRLAERGMRTGFACLFHGAPGTGKTETVMQIARQTGRDIMCVDIASMRDKFVGESEKNIKAVFSNYRLLCEKCDVTPILFFNEADALINKRVENVQHSVDKMDNAMQNIILQEIENLEGILIATTNLTKNLDRAFERRFIYKVEFTKPDVPVKMKLWNSMMGDAITEEQARILSNKFDFSGGQIENIARKNIVDYILSGTSPSFDDILTNCSTEILTQANNTSPIGFIR